MSYLPDSCKFRSGPGVSGNRGAKSSYETSPIKPEIGHLIRPRRRTRPRPRNRKQFKSTEDEHDYEATDELNLNNEFLIRSDWTLTASGSARMKQMLVFTRQSKSRLKTAPTIYNSAI
jgi:hypothetical protein